MVSPSDAILLVDKSDLRSVEKNLQIILIIYSCGISSQ